MAQHVLRYVELYSRWTNSITEGILCTISEQYFHAHVPTTATYRMKYISVSIRILRYSCMHHGWQISISILEHVRYVCVVEEKSDWQ